FHERVGEKNAIEDRRKDDLKNEFDPAADAVGLFLCDLEVIIREAKRPEIDHAEQSQPNELVVEASPHNTRHENGADNQHTSHGRCALLNAMQLCQTMNFCCSANRLSQLQGSQYSNDKISKN